MSSAARASVMPFLRSDSGLRASITNDRFTSSSSRRIDLRRFATSSPLPSMPPLRPPLSLAFSSFRCTSSSDLMVSTRYSHTTLVRPAAFSSSSATVRERPVYRRTTSRERRTSTTTRFRYSAFDMAAYWFSSSFFFDASCAARRLAAAAARRSSSVRESSRGREDGEYPYFDSLRRSSAVSEGGVGEDGEPPPPPPEPLAAVPVGVTDTVLTLDAAPGASTPSSKLTSATGSLMRVDAFCASCRCRRQSTRSKRAGASDCSTSAARILAPPLFHASANTRACCSLTPPRCSCDSSTSSPMA
mmetsp:Transcript_40384/g.99154  ORF Transcript_40384/g.99154 Transcript_40384/m.99154 type:complete len:302 (+) Transcript_40384:1954-2859(+)